MRAHFQAMAGRFRCRLCPPRFQIEANGFVPRLISRPEFRFNTTATLPCPAFRLKPTNSSTTANPRLNGSLTATSWQRTKTTASPTNRASMSCSMSCFSQFQCPIFTKTLILLLNFRWWLGAESPLFSRRCAPNMPDFIGYSSKNCLIQSYRF